MILQDYVRIVRRGAWLLVALVVVGAAAGFAFAATATPTYFTRATVMVSATGDTTPGGLSQASSFAVQRTPTYAGLAQTSVVLEKAVAQLGDGTTLTQLAEAVNVSARADSALIDVDAEAPSAAAAANRANAVAAALQEEAPSLDAPGGGAEGAVVLSTVQAAQVPLRADSPRPRNDVISGAVVGLALGVLVLALRHALDDRIRSAADVPRSRSLRVLSVLPRGRRGRQDEERSEALRRLRSVLAAASPGGAARGSVVVVSAVSSSSAKDADEAAVGLAQALVETGASVLVVDLTAPSRPLGVRGSRRTAAGSAPTPPRTDLASLAGEGSDIAWLVPEALGTTPAQLVGTEGGRAVLDEQTGGYEHRVLLCPPALERSEASVVGARATATLLVADAGRTTRSELQRAAGGLTAAGVPTVGVVLVGARLDEAWAG